MLAQLINEAKEIELEIDASMEPDPDRPKCQRRWAQVWRGDKMLFAAHGHDAIELCWSFAEGYMEGGNP